MLRSSVCVGERECVCVLETRHSKPPYVHSATTSRFTIYDISYDVFDNHYLLGIVIMGGSNYRTIFEIV